VAVRIRLARVGATKRPSYRVVAIDSRRSRDGRALEILGYYDPLTDPITVKVNEARVKAWMDNGALPSATVSRLLKIGAAPAAEAATKAPARRKPKAESAAE
jgi:small subunit ribosomal protein S16